MTVPQLFALSHGSPVSAGAIRCALCRGACADGAIVADVLDSGFTDWHFISGDKLCSGCMMTLRADKREDQPRLYSWVLTETTAQRFTKANLVELRHACTVPPPPPYAIVLATSGQKHLLFKSRPCFDSVIASVSLEGEQIEYDPAVLVARMRLANKIAAAAGKPALSEFDPTYLAIALSGYWLDWETLLNQWERVRSEPLSRLAAFLALKMEDAQREYPSDITADSAAAAAAKTGRKDVPAKAGRTAGPGLLG